MVLTRFRGHPRWPAIAGREVFMAAKKSQKRRHFTPEYKAEVVELFRKSGKTAGRVVA